MLPRSLIAAPRWPIARDSIFFPGCCNATPDPKHASAIVSDEGNPPQGFRQCRRPSSGINRTPRRQQLAIECLPIQRPVMDDLQPPLPSAPMGLDVPDPGDTVDAHPAVAGGQDALDPIPRVPAQGFIQAHGVELYRRAKSPATPNRMRWVGLGRGLLKGTWGSGMDA